MVRRTSGDVKMYVAERVRGRARGPVWLDQRTVRHGQDVQLDREQELTCQSRERCGEWMESKDQHLQS